MKKLLILTALSCVLFLGGCDSNSGNTAKPTEVDDIASVIGTSLVNGIKIDLVSVSHVEDTSSDDKKLLYIFEVNGENTSSVSKGLGASDFVLKMADDKEVVNDGTLASFGDEIMPGDNLAGKVYFWVEKDKEPKELVYQPTEEDTYTWKLEE